MPLSLAPPPETPVIATVAVSSVDPSVIQSSFVSKVVVPVVASSEITISAIVS